MLKDHAKLMAMFEQTGEIIGRKKLQKIIYIAKKMNVPFHERYNFHMFGPYSEELTLRIEELCNLGFLDEVKEKKSGYYQYRYSLTNEGEKFLKLYDFDLPKMDDLTCAMNQCSSRFLELVSTILYFDDLPKDEVKEKVMTLKRKQNYTDDDIDEAYDYIEQLQQTVVH
ncbi:YwgA family protein [Desertibacillus haloalkaliphilus]|uniref:YwgA family protein n=1 Tax=Desertibacillus haloalkaliphilus TaxID=1328930 RepID=UPI001C26B795|nr:YwgA family protein [Desertibacillus haloalkaliphilus]MBU8905834.1 YwgA family protein [Desertibacillus haloalkaliphilus]